jgi:hypothetical protein
MNGRGATALLKSKGFEVEIKFWRLSTRECNRWCLRGYENGVITSGKPTGDKIAGAPGLAWGLGYFFGFCAAALARSARQLSYATRC